MRQSRPRKSLQGHVSQTWEESNSGAWLWNNLVLTVWPSQVAVEKCLRFCHLMHFFYQKRITVIEFCSAWICFKIILLILQIRFFSLQHYHVHQKSDAFCSLRRYNSLLFRKQKQLSLHLLSGLKDYRFCIVHTKPIKTVPKMSPFEMSTKAYWDHFKSFRMVQSECYSGDILKLIGNLRSGKLFALKD